MPPSSLPDVQPQSQLETCARDFQHVTETARDLLTQSSEENLRQRPATGSWSALECVVHLNLCNQAMLPGIRQAVEAATQASSEKHAYRMDLAGRLLAWSLEPPPLIKMKTSAMVQPAGAADPQPVLEEFDRQHQELISLLHASAGKEIDRQKMKSPFANMRYNAYSAFRIIAAHDRRHLWQARKAVLH